MKDKVTIFWFRRDLRLYDNTALHHALSQQNNVLPIFIFDRAILSKLSDTKDKRVNFIYDTVCSLNGQLRKFGSRLAVFFDNPVDVFTALFQQYDIGAVYANEDYEPYASARDAAIADLASSFGCPFFLYKDQVIWAKNEVVKDDGTPYTVFTPYSKKWREKTATAPIVIHAKINTQNFFNTPYIDILPIEKFGFEKTTYHHPDTAINRETIIRYSDTRDFPALDATSKLSVHLRFGTVSIRHLYQQTALLNPTFINELIWREFYQQILWHFPHTAVRSFRKEYEAIEWANHEEHFQLWCAGKTGYPLVDAGMRQLNATGWMHNRVRMVVASFLTKHLLIDWRWGERYFAEKLMDYDMAANVGGWQWAAGCGTDAAPYFRVFNPALQQEKFDKEARYIQKWIPEWNTAHYPQPIVEHKWARERCLQAFKKALK